MHLKPINRQSKKRRKLTTLPALSCDGSEFTYPMAEKGKLPSSLEEQVFTKKDKAAA